MSAAGGLSAPSMLILPRLSCTTCGGVPGPFGNRAAYGAGFKSRAEEAIGVLGARGFAEREVEIPDEKPKESADGLVEVSNEFLRTMS